MIQLSPLPVAPQGTVRPALLASGSASSFTLALGALVVPRAGGPADEGEVLPGRQMLAPAGKDLPALPTVADGDDSAEEQDAPEDGADIAFAWFAVAPVAQPVPATPGLAAAAPPVEVEVDTSAQRPAAMLIDLPTITPLKDPAGTEPAAPDVPVQEATVEHLAATLPTPRLAAPAERVEVPSISAADIPDLPAPDAPTPARSTAGATANPTAISIPMPARPAASIAPGEQPVQQAEASARAIEPPIQLAERASTQVRLSSVRKSAEQAPMTQPRLPVAASPVTPINPAIQVLAHMPAAPAPLRRALAEEAAALAIVPSAPDATQPHAVSTAADVQQAPLDTRRQEWMGKMVEHIEALRDAAPGRETRISLAPEALGKVDVSIRHEGDRVHVHFTTETQAARQLIADAQPRLTELAEARGLKLGQTSFESGTAGQGPNRDSRSNPAPQQSRAPRPAHSETAVGTADDERIA